MSIRVLKQVLLFAAVAFSSAGFAQPALIRTTFTGTYSPISTVSGATASSAIGDNAFQDFIPIGFTFNYLGTNYTTIGVNTNGVAAFSGINASATNTDLYTSTAPNTLLAPWWDDLSVANGTGTILYQTQGSPGTRNFTIQWTDAYSFHSGATALLNFQIVLFESDNRIEFRYGAAPSGTFNASESASIGVKNAVGGNGAFIDAVTGSSFTGNAMVHASATWPSRFFRFAPGIPSAVNAGIYTVGATGNYTSLSEAVADLNHRGVSGNGAVTLSLIDSIYDETPAHGANFFPILLGPVANTSIASSVVIQGSLVVPAEIHSSGAQAGVCVTQSVSSAITTSNEPVIAFVGAKHCGLRHAWLRSTTADVDRGISMLNSSSTMGTRYCGIFDLHVTLDRSNVNTIAMEQRLAGGITSSNGANSFNVYQELYIRNTYSGISFTGDATYPDSSCTIGAASPVGFLSIGSATEPIGGGIFPVYGIRVTNANGISISRAIIQQVSTNGAARCDGIVLDNAGGYCSVHGNVIHDLRNNSASDMDEVTGIRVSVNSGAHHIRVYNNFIYELHSSYNGSSSGTRQIRGIFVQPAGGGSSSAAIDVDFNTIYLNPASLGLSNCCLEIGTTSGPVINVRNNIFVNGTAAQTSPAGHYCWISYGANATGNTGSISNNNNFYIVNASGGFAGRGGSTDYTALSDWQTAMTQDANAVQIDPQFTSAGDLHVHNTLLNSIGVSVTGITTDIDGEVRATVPDIGADEIFPQDAAAVSLVTPVPNDCYSANEQVVIRVRNDGPEPLDFSVDTVHVTVKITGPVNTTLTAELHDNSQNSGLPLGVNATTDVVVGTMNMTANGNYTFKAWTTLRGDGNHLNDSIVPVVITKAPLAVNVTGDTIICSGNSTLLTANVSGGAGPYSYQWTTGSTASAITFAPTVDTTLFVSVTDGCGMFANMPVHLSVDPAAVAGFTYNVSNSTVTFTNTSSSSTNYAWDFGDSQSSSQASPSHTYTSTGTFTITLTSSNSCNSDTATATITIITTGITLAESESGFHVYPNPVTDQFSILFFETEQNVHTELFDETGRLVQAQDLGNIPAGQTVVIRTEGYRNGTYLLKVISEGRTYTEKIIVQE